MATVIVSRPSHGIPTGRAHAVHEGSYTAALYVVDPKVNILGYIARIFIKSKMARLSTG